MSKYTRFKEWIDKKSRVIDEAKIQWLLRLFEEEEAKGKDPAIIGEGDTFSNEGYYLLRVVDVEKDRGKDLLVDKKVVRQMYDASSGLGLLVNEMIRDIEEE